MFMIKENIAQKEEIEKLYKRVEMVYGKVPEQIKLLANIDISYAKDFLKMIISVIKHPTIDADIFAFVRLHLASKHCSLFCIDYNREFLLAKGYASEILDLVITDIENIPSSPEQKALAVFTIKGFDTPTQCRQADFDTLYEMGWSQKDLFDILSHTGTFLSNSQLLNIYMKKED